MIKPNTIFFNGREIGIYKSVQRAGTGHINFSGFELYEGHNFNNIGNMGSDDLAAVIFATSLSPEEFKEHFKLEKNIL